MSKGKPRHNPDKPANKYGDRCPYYEEYTTGKVGCECKSFHGDSLECKGNRHNCVKVKYHQCAIDKKHHLAKDYPEL